LNATLPIRLSISIDPYNQIFVSLTIAANNANAEAFFKIDTGCNAVILSRKTLNDLGIDTTPKALAERPLK
jgi:hypothetical protein